MNRVKRNKSNEANTNTSAMKRESLLPETYHEIRLRRVNEYIMNEQGKSLKLDRALKDAQSENARLRGMVNQLLKCKV